MCDDLFQKSELIIGAAGHKEALIKEAMEQAKKVAVDHLAAKQEQLRAAMEKISKYKKKYSSLNGIKELSEKPRNEMRGMPLYAIAPLSMKNF